LIVEIPFILEYLIVISALIGVFLTAVTVLKLKKINPNMFYTEQVTKTSNNTKIFDFRLLYVLLGKGISFTVAAFAVMNLVIFIIENEWIAGEFAGKLFLTLAIGAGILFYVQEHYYFIKEKS